MKGDIIPTQTVKSKMILIIIVLIGLSVQAETISNKIDRSDGIVEDLVEMKDFRQVLNELAKLKEDLNELPKLKEDLIELAKLKKDLTELAKLKEDLTNNSIELNKLKKQIADEPNFDDVVEKLKQLSKIGTLRSCVKSMLHLALEPQACFP